MAREIIIWNDNTYAYNYRLSFDDNDRPEKLTLTKRADDKNNIEFTWVFDIVSKDYVDAADNNLQLQINAHDGRLDAVEAHNLTQDGRLNDLESADMIHDSRLDAVEQKDRDQDSRLDNIDILNQEQNDRLTSLELNDETQDNRLALIEAKNEEQDDRLNDIDGLNNGQNGRLDLIEEVNRDQDASIDNLNTLVGDIRNSIASDVCKYHEMTLPYTVPDLPLGVYRVHANFRLETSYAIYPVPVMGIMVVSQDNGVKESYFNLRKSDVVGRGIADVNVSYFNGNLELSAVLSRDLDFAEFIAYDLTDFTFDKIIGVGDGGDTSNFVLRTGDIMQGDLDMNGYDLLGITIDNPLA